MKLGIIILVTRPYAIALCLDRLCQQTFGHKNFEIILVLSKDLAIDLPKTDIRIVKVIENNLHLCIRRNIGVKYTTAELIAFLDDDTLPGANWVENALHAMTQHPCDGVCGPITHFNDQKPLSRRLAGAATDSMFLEGFNDAFVSKPRPIEFYNTPGCNCVIKRTVWESVGGFNEHMYSYMDDLEFFYMAAQHKFYFLMIPELAVQHDIAPFPFDYLKKKLITRFHTGVNTILFHEAHWKTPSIKLAFLCMGGALLMPLCIKNHFALFSYLCGIYAISAIISSLKFLTINPLTFLLLPFVFLITHIVNAVSFFSGLFYALLFRKRFHSVVSFKKARLQKTKNGRADEYSIHDRAIISDYA